MQDFSFQGKLYLGNRLPGGRPGALRWVGDAPKCDLTLKTETETRKESYSGNRLTSAVLQKGKDILTLNERRARLDERPLAYGNTIYMQQQDHSAEAIAAMQTVEKNCIPRPPTPGCCPPPALSLRI